MPVATDEFAVPLPVLVVSRYASTPGDRRAESRPLCRRGGRGRRRGGGDLADDPEALVWLDSHEVGGLAEALSAAPGVRWVQLPSAGVEPMTEVIDQDARLDLRQRRLRPTGG